MRATSSIRSTSRVTSSRRSAGTVTSRPSGAPARGEVERARGSPPGARRATATPRIAAHARARAARISRGGAGSRSPTSIVPGATRRAAQLDHQLRGDRLRVHALLGLRAPSRSARRPRCAGRAPTRCGGCSGRSRWRPPAARGVVSGCDLRARAAHQPGDRGRARRRPRSRPSRASSVRVWPSSVCTCSPSRARRTVSRAPGDAVEVEGVQRLAGEQHHVVGDVDDVVDRPLPGGGQARLQPRRRGRRS